MKKYLLIIGIASAMFAACSSSEEGLSQDGANPIDEENMTREQLMGTVPIEIAGVDLGMKVDVEVQEKTRSGATAIPENQQLGIFCLSYKKLASDDELAASYFNWQDAASYRTLNRWQDNVKAHIQLNSESLGLMCWDDRNAPRYYPKSDLFAYEFVAYQPYTEAVQYAQSTITAWIPLDGDDDVMYAVSDKPRNNVVTEELAGYAYGSHYFSEVYSQGAITDNHKPYFRFSHLLSKLIFNIKLKNVTEGHTFHVDAISIRNLTNIARLYLASRSSSGASVKNGHLTCFADVNSNSVPEAVRPYLIEKGATGKGTYYLREKDGSSISDLMAGDDYKYTLSTTDAKTIGDGIYIPASSGTLKIDIYLCDQNGSRTTSSEPITVNAPAGGWQAGKFYNINVSITPPKYFMDDTRGVINAWEAGVDVSSQDIEAEF